MGKKRVASVLGVLIACGGIVFLVLAGKEALGGNLQNGVNDTFLAVALFFIALVASQIFSRSQALPTTLRVQEPRFTPQAPRAEKMRALVLDAWALAIPLLSLADMVLLATFYTNPQVYPATHAGYIENDYYRYVNMALDHGDPRYVFAQPFLYRVLVPSAVHLFSHLGVPFRTGFYANTLLGLIVSTVALYFLARGAGLSRFASSCTAVVFTLLSWTVTYNVSDYFLIDTTTEAFIAVIVLAVQRRRFIPAIILGTIGAADKETIYLPVAFSTVQLVVPYLEPLSVSLGQLLRLQVAQVIRLVPNRNWLLLVFQVGGPLTVTGILHAVIPLAHPVGLLVLWKSYLHAHVLFGIKNTIASSLWYTFGIMLFLALGAMALRLWSRARWSGWGVFTVLVIILYSYAVSGDSQRLSVIGWPFVLVLAALMINEMSRRLNLSEYILWPLAIVVMLLNFPTYPNDPGHFQPVTFLGYIMVHLDWRVEAALLLIATVTLFALVSKWVLQPGERELAPEERETEKARALTASAYR
jgi:hypothetical protein